MSSEYSIHLGDKPIEGKVYDLGGTFPAIMVTVEVEAPFGSTADAEIKLFISRDRLLEASLLFHKIAQDLAALLPNVDREQFEADQGQGHLIPCDEAAEHVEPPHRYG